MVTLTRPDTSHVVRVAGKYMPNRMKPRREAIWIILMFAKSTTYYGLLYNKESGKLYCDNDYTGHRDTRRFTSGYVFYLGLGAIY